MCGDLECGENLQLGSRVKIQVQKGTKAASTFLHLILRACISNEAESLNVAE